MLCLGRRLRVTLSRTASRATNTGAELLFALDFLV
jgi:hypothetical protein